MLPSGCKKVTQKRDVSILWLKSCNELKSLVFASEFRLKLYVFVIKFSQFKCFCNSASFASFHKKKSPTRYGIGIEMNQYGLLKRRLKLLRRLFVLRELLL